MMFSGVDNNPAKGLQHALADFFGKDFSKEEKEGLAVVVSSLLRYRSALILLVLSNFIAALFEGGTLGLLGLAVSALIGNGPPELPEFAGNFGKVLNEHLKSLTPSYLFLALVSAAVVAQIIKAVMLYVGEAIQIYLSYGMRRTLQKDLTHQIVSMSYSRVSTYPTGTLVNIIDQSSLVTDVSVQLGNVSRAALMGIAYFVMMFLISWKLALATALITWALWVLLTQVSRRLRKIAIAVTAGQIDLWRSTVEYLNSPRLLRLFNAGEYAERVIGKSRDAYLFPDRKADIIVAAIPKILEIITVTGAGAFLVGGFLVFGDNATTMVPALFVYVLIFFRLRPIIKAFNDYRLKVARVRPRLRIVSEIFNAPQEAYPHQSQKKFEGLKEGIVFKSVSFRFPGEKRDVLKNINLEIPRGSTLALIGPSGAGKSTIMDLLLGLHSPTTGKIDVDGMNLGEICLRDWREHIGVVDQEVFLLNTSILENIRFGREKSSLESIEAAARTAHAHEFIVQMSEGYQTVIGERGFKLSGGQQQRLVLARALLREPDILVLDEATSALDAEAEKAIQTALDELHHHRTILVIAHRFSTIANADFVAVIKDGQIIEFGERSKLLGQLSEFSKLWKLQMIDQNI